MQFRYKDPRGKIVEIPDVASLLRAIESGALSPETQLAVGRHGPWQRADSVPAYLQAVEGLTRSPGLRRGPSAPIGIESSQPASRPWMAQPRIRVALAAAGVLLLLAFGAWRLRYLDGERASRTARAVTAAAELSPGSQHALTVMTAEFGDSAALAIRRADEWFNSQGIATRLRGASLKSPASLRALRAAALRARANADSLVSRGAVLAGLLRARAESLEVADARYDGLILRLEEALDRWRRDVDEYAGLHRGFTATLDSVAVFVLERQGSVALHVGQAAFLSRADGVRFRDLSDQLRVLSQRKKAWADGVVSRRPTWMAALPDSLRPRFAEPQLPLP